MHKTLVTDWLAYAQNISQPSFVGSSTSSALGICLQCLCRNPALIITQVLSPLLRVYGGRRGFFVVPIPRQLYILQWSRTVRGRRSASISVLTAAVYGALRPSTVVTCRKRPQWERYFRRRSAGTAGAAGAWRRVETRRWRWCRWPGWGNCWCSRARRRKTECRGRCGRRPTRGTDRNVGRRRWRCSVWRTGPNTTKILLRSNHTFVCIRYTV